MREADLWLRAGHPYPVHRRDNPLAEPSDVSLDYPALDHQPDTRAGALLADRELVEKLAAIDRLSERDKEKVKPVLKNFILKDRFQELVRDQQPESIARCLREARGKS